MYEANVARGMALLTDEQIQSVNLDTLSMGDLFHCVLGQIYGSFQRGVAALYSLPGEKLCIDPPGAYDAGFAVPYPENYREIDVGPHLYDELTAEWRKQIEHYRTSRHVPSAEARSSSPGSH
jgi:hypothetical protein